MKGKIRLCIVTNQLDDVKSGPGIHTRILASELPKKNVDVTVIYPSNKSTDSIAKQYPGVKLVRVRPGRSLGHASWFLLSKILSKRLEKLLLYRKFDIIHFTDAKYALYFNKRKAGKAKIVGNVNDFYIASAKKNPLFYRKYFDDWKKRWLYYNAAKRLEKRALLKFDKVICNTEFVLKELNKNYGISKNKLCVINKAADLDDIKKIKPKKAKGKRLIFVGGNFYRKGVPLVIDSLLDVKKEFPGIKFLIVGNDANKDKLKRYSESLGLKKNVEFLGWKKHDEALKLMSASDIFVMPSLFEAFGVVYLESMALGLPVIGSRVGGTKELVTDRKNGFLVDPTDTKELSRKILLLLKDNKLRKKIIDNAKKRANDFSSERMIRETIKLYKKSSLLFHVS